MNDMTVQVTHKTAEPVSYAILEGVEPPTAPALKLTPNAIKVLERRYLKKDADGNPVERPEDMFWRVARNIASADLHFDAKADVEKTATDFYSMMANLSFMPNSPTLMNAGRDLQQLSACFVLPVGDSMEDIFETLKHTALIHKSGGGTGFAFSRLRPKNDRVKSTHGVSSGPVSFMKIFDSATEHVKQGGTRRGANMGILRVDHPDILEFIECKSSGGIQNFNISVTITDKFMEALEKGTDYALINPRDGSHHSSMNAREVFGKIVDMAWKTGDPGLVFIDRINAFAPTPAQGLIEATNPCGELPLQPNDACTLGSVNLAQMFDANEQFDWDKLKATVRTATHFLDNVLEVNNYPLPQISDMTRGNRKIGLGVMGFADMLIRMGVSYNSEKAVGLADKVMRCVNETAREKSFELGEERGEYPFRELESHIGRRNATVTTIAPTGTISMIAGCSSGIEPLFAIAYVKNVMDNTALVYVEPEFEAVAKRKGFHSETLMQKIAKQGNVHDMQDVPEDVRKVFVTSHEIAPEWHVKIQAAFQTHVENSVSKTINLPNAATTDDVREAYLLAWKTGCKGITIYRDGCKDTQVLYTGTSDPNAKQETQISEQEFKLHIKPRPRPAMAKGQTMKIGTGCGNLYVTINEDEHGPNEVFSQMGKTGGCAAAQSEAVSRLASLAFRAGVEPCEVVEQLGGIRCPLPSWQAGGMVLSCPDAISKVLKTYLGENGTSNGDAAELEKSSKRGDVVGMCPDCGHVLEFVEGCAVCKSCGFSKCG